MRHRRLTATLAGAGLLVACLLVARTPGSGSPVRPAALTAARHHTTTTLRHLPAGTQYDRQATRTYLLADGPTNWNPHAAASAEPATEAALTTVLGAVLPSVFTVGPGYHVSLDTSFVTSARQVGTAPQTVRYQINPQATWSDGTPITYQDFVYAWQSQSGESGPTDVGGAAFTPASTDGYDQIASVTDVGGDPYSVSVSFVTPDAGWRSLFSLLLPAHVARTVGFDTGFTDPTDLLSGGPFEVQSATPGQSVTVVRNPRWWGPQVPLAQVQYRIEPVPQRVLPAFAQGEVDVGSVRPTAGLARGLAKVEGVSSAVVAGPVWDHLDFNQAHPVLADVALRQAIMLAVDRTGLIRATVGRSGATVRPLDNLLFARNEPGYRDDAGGYAKGDVAGARAALVSAGYLYQGGTLLHAGEPVTLDLTTDGDPLHRAVARFVVSALAPLGITVTETVSADLTATLTAGAFDLAVVTSTASPFLAETAGRYQTNDHDGSGAADLDGISDPTIDAQVAQAATAPAGPARTRAYQRLDRTLWGDAVSLPLFQEPELVAWDRTSLDVGPNAGPGGTTWNVAEWGVQAAS